MNPYDYINGFSKFGSLGGFKPGLDRIRTMLEFLEYPQEKLPIIHIAGSNGKGSTIAFLKHIYRRAGYRVGVYTSPHLLAFNERIEVNGQLISTKELTELVELIAPVIEQLSRDNFPGKPSYFELVTAIAFLYFSRQDLDLVLLEVGLGGRLDATNIVSAPLASLITGISLEHTAILGDTTAAIAREKAGIIKKGRPVLTAVLDQKARQVIEEVAAQRDCQLLHLDELYQYRVKESSLQGQLFYLQAKDFILAGNKVEGFEQELFIRLPGLYQIRNALLAMLTVSSLHKVLPTEQCAITAGLKEAYLPGRMELVREDPHIILDGTHTREGMEALLQSLAGEITAGKQIWLILSLAGDKDADGIIKLLREIKNLKLLLTRNSSERALEPEILQAISDSYQLNNRLYPSLKAALQSSIEQAGRDDLIIVTGSLYNIAEAKIYLGI